MACLRLFTFLPLLPLLSVPRLRLRIARSTSFEALREYRRAMVELRVGLSRVDPRLRGSGHGEPPKTTAKRCYLFQFAPG
jgi:hypothetical protein